MLRYGFQEKIRSDPRVTLEESWNIYAFWLERIARIVEIQGFVNTVEDFGDAKSRPREIHYLYEE